MKTLAAILLFDLVLLAWAFGQDAPSDPPALPPPPPVQTAENTATNTAITATWITTQTNVVEVAPSRTVVTIWVYDDLTADPLAERLSVSHPR